MMSEKKDEENLATLNSILGRYQKKTLNLSRKKPEPIPPSDDEASQSDAEMSSDEETEPHSKSESKSKLNSEPELPPERDDLPQESIGDSELPEEVSIAPSEDDYHQASEFPAQNSEFPSELPDIPSFVTITEPSAIPMLPLSHPSTSTSTQLPRFNVVHKAPPKNNRRISPLTVVTYNMWFGETDFVNRVHHLIKVLLTGHKYKPDLVCLQEVTPQSYQILQKGLGNNYYLFEIFGDPPMRYCNLIAINKETMDIVDDTLGYYDLPETQMSRKLMICYVTIKKTGTRFHILNTHLESFDTHWKNRQQQMEFIDQILEEEKVSNFILCGDFNICKDDEPIESHIRLAGYSDAWMEMGSPQSLKHTYNSKTNRYAKGDYKSRLDRILYRFGNNDQVAITKLKLLGIKEPLPSDHYGVLSEFLIKKSK